MSRLRGGAGRAVLGLVVSVAALAFVVRQVDLSRTADILSRASLGWIAVMILFQVADLTLRAIRWQRLVNPIHHVRFLPITGYLLIGYLANNVLPARLGELVRCHYLGDREGISRTTVLGTVVVERVVDTAVVVGLASAAILVLHVRGLVASAVLIGLAVTGLLVVALAVGLAAHRLPGAARVVALAERWPRLREMARKLRGGLAVAGRPRTLAEALFLSLAAWSATVVAFAAAGQSLGIQMTMAQAALLAAGVALATAIPAGPSNLGTFDLAAVAIAATFGLDQETALALALIAHASILITTSVGGAVALIALGWRQRAAVTPTDDRAMPEVAQAK
jgi:glycosyltransferase 2 family protein